MWQASRKVKAYFIVDSRKRNTHEYNTHTHTHSIKNNVVFAIYKGLRWGPNYLYINLNKIADCYKVENFLKKINDFH